MTAHNLDPHNARAATRIDAQAYGLGLAFVLLLPLAIVAAAHVLNRLVAAVAPGEVDGGQP